MVLPDYVSLKTAIKGSNNSSYIQLEHKPFWDKWYSQSQQFVQEILESTIKLKN